MIVGRGNIASVIADRADVLFFASGVADSQCVNYDEFNREKRLLSVYYDPSDTRSLFYFSSICVNFINTPYAKHKREMEDMIRTYWKNFCIVRIGNIEWDQSPKTFVNYIKANPGAEIKDEYRYMIDKETFVMLCNSLPSKGKHEITATSHIKKVIDYVS